MSPAPSQGRLAPAALVTEGRAGSRDTVGRVEEALFYWVGVSTLPAVTAQSPAVGWAAAVPAETTGRSNTAVAVGGDSLWWEVTLEQAEGPCSWNKCAGVLCSLAASLSPSSLSPPLSSLSHSFCQWVLGADLVPRPA